MIPGRNWDGSQNRKGTTLTRRDHGGPYRRMEISSAGRSGGIGRFQPYRGGKTNREGGCRSSGSIAARNGLSFGCSHRGGRFAKARQPLRPAASLCHVSGARENG